MLVGVDLSGAAPLHQPKAHIPLRTKPEPRPRGRAASKHEASEAVAAAAKAAQVARESRAEDYKPIIVLDAPNIAMRHGKKEGSMVCGKWVPKRFSCLGIKKAVEYYQSRGHKVVAFLPDFHLDFDIVAGQKRAASAGLDWSPSRTPDNVEMLLKLQQEGVLVGCPSWDYDDSYTIKYAKAKDGCIITNDRYWDFIDKCQKAGENRALHVHWMRSHCISYTFVEDEFLPNPDFEFP